jgi:hypothetical protein
VAGGDTDALASSNPDVNWRAGLGAGGVKAQAGDLLDVLKRLNEHDAQGCERSR